MRFPNRRLKPTVCSNGGWRDELDRQGIGTEGEKNPGGGEEGGDRSKKRAKAGNVGKSGQVSVCNWWSLTTKAVILAQSETEEQRGKKSSQKEVRGREWMLLASQGGVAGSPTYFLDVFVLVGGPDFFEPCFFGFQQSSPLNGSISATVIF